VGPSDEWSGRVQSSVGAKLYDVPFCLIDNANSILIEPIFVGIKKPETLWLLQEYPRAVEIMELPYAQF
jgi:hypothetical protein